MGASTSSDILSDAQATARAEIVDLLTTAYWMEIETVMSYIANSTNPDGVRAQEVTDSLAADVAEELGHAQKFARRIKELYGTVPGSSEFHASQESLQPPSDSLDLTHVIRGVIDAERGAIEHYSRIIAVTDGVDPVTQDMLTTILADEQNHLRTFEGFLREYEADRA
jgi:bacterioferritin